MTESKHHLPNGAKAIYPTLAKAIAARCKVARQRGDRWRSKLRIYRVAAGWCLTKMTKGQLL
jgi:hypothetical protein